MNKNVVIQVNATIYLSDVEEDWLESDKIKGILDEFLSAEDLTFCCSTADIKESTKVLSQEELEKLLPFGKEFSVAVDYDGLIIQHPYKDQPLYKTEISEAEGYLDLSSKILHSEGNLFVDVPEIVTTLEEFWCLVE